jgi:hypothetical protein
MSSDSTTRPTVHRSGFSRNWRRDAVLRTLRFHSFLFSGISSFFLFFSLFFFFFPFFAFSPFAFQLPHNFLERSMVRSRGTLSFSNWIYLGLYAFSHPKIYINPFVAPRISVLQHIHFKVHSFFLFILFSLEIDSRCIPYICRPDSIHIPTISFSPSFYLSR